jgi:hypothetical protein
MSKSTPVVAVVVVVAAAGEEAAAVPARGAVVVDSRRRLQRPGQVPQLLGLRQVLGPALQLLALVQRRVLVPLEVRPLLGRQPAMLRGAPVPRLAR